jgi:hypothetical protein
MQSADQAENNRLTRTVGTDNGENFTLHYLEAYVIDGYCAPEILDQILSF